MSILLCLVFALAFAVCAFLMLSHGFAFFGILLAIGSAIMLVECFRFAGAWSEKKPWNGEGE